MFGRSARDVEQELGVNEQVLNAYLRGSLWALHTDAERAGRPVPASRGLWQAVRGGHPRLRIYYVFDEEDCELMWLEVDPEWFASRRDSAVIHGERE